VGTQARCKQALGSLEPGWTVLDRADGSAIEIEHKEARIH
jgi:hypothetical protein